MLNFQIRRTGWCGKQVRNKQQWTDENRAGSRESATASGPAVTVCLRGRQRQLTVEIKSAPYGALHTNDQPWIYSSFKNLEGKSSTCSKGTQKSLHLWLHSNIVRGWGSRTKYLELIAKWTAVSSKCVWQIHGDARRETKFRKHSASLGYLYQRQRKLLAGQEHSAQTARPGWPLRRADELALRIRLPLGHRAFNLHTEQVSQDLSF